MPKYKVVAPDGRTVVLTGDSAPTEADLDEVFANLPPKQQETGMDAETAQAFNESNQTLRDIDTELNRGNNFGGGVRNIMMGLIPGTAETEAALRATKQSVLNIDPTAPQAKKTDESWNESYDRYLQNARESREGYKRANPARAGALQILGGIGGAFLPYTKAAKLAQGANFARQSAISGLTGLGVGGAFGFGNSQGGLENRLRDAGRGAFTGGVIGVVAPTVGMSIGGGRNILSRLKSGWGRELPQEQVESFMLSKTLAPTTESRSLTLPLGWGSARGAKDVENAAYDLLKLRQTMNEKIKPASFGGKTAGGTTAKDFLNATQTKELTAAKKNYGEFVENIPTAERPTKPVQALFEDNKTAVKILDDNADLFRVQGQNGAVETLDPGSFEYWQKAQQILSNKLPKKYDPSKLTGAKKDVYNAVEKVRKTREKLFPGTKQVNAEYSDAVATQKFADKQLDERLRVMSAQQEPPKVSSSIAQVLDFLGGGAYRRGVAREIIRNNGALRQPLTESGYRNAGSTLDSLLRAVLGSQ